MASPDGEGLTDVRSLTVTVTLPVSITKVPNGGPIRKATFRPTAATSEGKIKEDSCTSCHASGYVCPTAVLTTTEGSDGRDRTLRPSATYLHTATGRVV